MAVIITLERAIRMQRRRHFFDSTFQQVKTRPMRAKACRRPRAEWPTRVPRRRRKAKILSS